MRFYIRIKAGHTTMESQPILLPWVKTKARVTFSGLAYNSNLKLSTWLEKNKEKVIETCNTMLYTRVYLYRNPAALPFCLRTNNYTSCMNYIMCNSHPLALTHVYNKLANMNEKHIKLMCWNNNPLVVEWLINNCKIDDLNWFYLSDNPAAIDFLLKHPSQIVWYKLIQNSHPRLIQYIRDHHMDKLDDQEYCMYLAVKNPSKEAGELLQELDNQGAYYRWVALHGTLEQIHQLPMMDDTILRAMTSNPNAIPYFEAHPEVIRPDMDFGSNPAIFV